MVNHLKKRIEGIAQIGSQDRMSEKIGEKNIEEFAGEEISLEILALKNSRSLRDKFIDHISSIGDEFRF